MLSFAARQGANRSAVRSFSSSGASSQSYSFSKYPFLKELGIQEQDNPAVFDGEEWGGSGETVTSYDPSTGEAIATVRTGTVDDYNRCVERMMAAKKEWMSTPAPKRGDVVRQMGNRFREKLEPLGKLVTLEMGKIKAEGIGEVQEVVDTCELAVGLSRQIPGQLVPSERPDHALLETWNPLGAMGMITAFNFPNAVAGWNASISLVCGNTQIWKGAPSTNLVSIATQKIMADVLVENGYDGGIATLCCGGADVGKAMASDGRLPLISFTGSTAIGRDVATTVAGRFGRSILELGGNNAVTVMDDADLNVALPSVVFAAMGTAGQRCTTARRLLIHESIYDEFVEKLCNAYRQIQPGSPLEDGTLLGPLHNQAAVNIFKDGLQVAQAQGGKILVGGSVVENSNYAMPTLIEIDHSAPCVMEERFVPITYVVKVGSLEEAIELNNSVPQGLSSALFTSSMRSTFQFLGPNGSDCGISNVGTSCSGAEIGLGFGGNKETGWGRESGSDSWKQYMRRGSCTVNYGTSVPLAQGLKFG
mmetsp:Transcript_19598/g.55124  ORF Transcript_19598/g.55124 Transcript_19598/m.55124 type:complete len:534 (-) Transcript_19598:181-1782(-)|eukprot:CAMPEP_0119132970 /NCGR_PEP_ID=MMETSP1310-20130426/12714_1 /TAXON_ID=464262 /ORGANISM="Genus nov. species nov., Strain RCC2339" /LENGTH=533 /DNA_ID=CAMNT_0007123639 /DNA_START=114 /DNA_END=1715 /DNA_ORIENTATION=+